MITLKLQLLLVAFSVAVFVVFVGRTLRYKLELKYALVWIFFSAAGVIVAIFPQIVFFIARIMGIEVPVNAVFLLAVSSIFLILYSLTVSLSNHSRKLRTLTQEAGLMNRRIEELERRLQEAAPTLEGGRPDAADR